MNQFTVRVWSRSIVTVLFLIFAVSQIMASTEEWTGLGRDYKWKTNGNWNNGFGIQANDDLVFGDQVCRLFSGCFTTFRRSLMSNDFPVNTSFDSIRVFGRGFQFNGNQIFLKYGMEVGEGIGRVLVTSDPRFNFNIILGASQTWSNKSGTTTFNGVVNLNGKRLTTEVLEGDETQFNFLINGTGELSKTGPGIVFINGAANQFGPTTILDGGVRVDGSLGIVNLRGSGEIQGNGYTGKIDARGQTTGGSISPGDGLDDSGVLHVSGGVDLSQSGVLKINLNGPTLGAQYDQLQVSDNTVTLSGPRLELSLGFVPTPGQEFTIVRQIGTGAVVGQFSNGTAIVEDNQLFFITYLQDRVILTAQGTVGP